MYLQGKESVFDLIWTQGPQGPVTYGDVYHQNEREMSAFNFEVADTYELFRQLALDQVLKASHTFNLLDARHAVSVTERQRYILRVRKLARAVAQAYYEAREQLGFPMATR